MKRILAIAVVTAGTLGALAGPAAAAKPELAGHQRNIVNYTPAEGAEPGDVVAFIACHVRGAC